MEFLVRLEINLPEAGRDKIISAERAMGADLKRDGKLVRVWRDPAQSGNWTLWNVRDADEFHALISALPAFPYFRNVKVYPLAGHPIDPGPESASGDVGRQ